MHAKALLFAIFIVFPFASNSFAQTQAPTLEERMSHDEFTSAGLDKLTPEQLQFLNSWIQSKGVSQINAPIQRRDGTTMFYPDSSDREEIESNIVGDFEGWRGNTRVTLENGQVWQQSESGQRVSRMSSPKVTIKPLSFGSWIMYVDGCGCDVRVRRIK